MMNDWGNGNYELLHLALPVGISFYTFENLSYTVDVYKGHFKPVNKFIDYLFFLSYFPKLMMGPIVRAADFLPQIRQRIELKSEDLSYGFYFILTGAFKKMVISDFLYTNIVQVVFDDPTRYSGLYCLTAVYAYAMVIYCDFSGYSDMAIGIARWMGLKIEINFLAPYQSSSITEFWRRWHISLSSWFKDYLYFPLGGSKGGNWMRIRNTFIIFIVSGFWHGANWTFIIWGALNAFFILPSIVLKSNRKNLETVAQGKLLPTVKEFFQMTVTFTLVVLARIFFRAQSLGHAFQYITGIFSIKLLSAPSFKESDTGSFIFPKTFILFILIFMFIEWHGREEQFAISNLDLKWRRVFRWSLYISLVLAIFYLSNFKENTFIYFQF